MIVGAGVDSGQVKYLTDHDRQGTDGARPHFAYEGFLSLGISEIIKYAAGFVTYIRLLKPCRNKESVGL